MEGSENMLYINIFAHSFTFSTACGDIVAILSTTCSNVRAVSRYFVFE